MTIRIYGAGMAGLLAATMLRRRGVVVHEKQADLPDNHGALLRFRSDAVATETGIPFRKVRVLKAVRTHGSLRTDSTLQDANLYSQKVTGEVRSRSILDLAPCDRYIAPPDFLTMLARDVPIKFDRELTIEDLQHHQGQTEHVIISTIPMPALMSIVNWPSPPSFSYRSVWSVTLTIEEPVIDIHQTIYYPDPDVPYYRASFTGNRLTIEFVRDPMPEDGPPFADMAATQIFRDFGITSYTANWSLPKEQEFGKLLPMDERARQEFILAMTDTYNVYSVGRFATWRQILLDDVVRDIRVVESMFTQRTAYHRRLLMRIL